jgi:hypothetical protein
VTSISSVDLISDNPRPGGCLIYRQFCSHSYFMDRFLDFDLSAL